MLHVSSGIIALSLSVFYHHIWNFHFENFLSQSKGQEKNVFLYPKFVVYINIVIFVNIWTRV